MKTKALLSACALTACLAACTNEDFLTEQSNANAAIEANSVVGADLVSHGMNIVWEDGGVDTRATNGSWKKNDRLGLAWYRFDGDDITKTQRESVWNSGRNWEEDDNIYANHMFSAVEDGANTQFTTTTDVYQGAYFAYWPYAKQQGNSSTGIVPKTIKVNDMPQIGNYDYERWNQALMISAQNFIGYNEGTDKNGTLQMSFSPVPMVNMLVMNATPDENITGDDVLKGLTITEMEVDAGRSNKIFVTEATLVPRNLPKKLATETLDETREKVYEAADAATKNSTQNSILEVNEKENTLTTKVLNPEYTLAQADELRAFALPIIQKAMYSSTQNPTAKVTVGRLHEVDGESQLWYELGEFAIDAEDEFIQHVKEALTAEETSTYSWLKVMRNETNRNTWQVRRNSMVANLGVDNFKPLTNNITCKEQWNDLVDIYNSLVNIKGLENVEKPTFNLTSEVVFDGEIRVPTCGVELSTSRNGQMTITGETVWPESLTANGDAKVYVDENGVMNYNPSKDAVIDAVITNDGLINVGGWGALSTDGAHALINNNRIVIEYGAYIYPDNGEEGIIAYRMTADNEIARLNKLLNGGPATKGSANINTVIIPAGIELNLNAKVETDGNTGDRYEEDIQGSSDDLSAEIKNTRIELEGGTLLTDDRENSNFNTVGSVVVTAGTTNLMKDVLTEKISIEKGDLTIDSEPLPLVGKKELSGVESIDNAAGCNLNVKTDVEVDNLKNYGKIDVDADYTVTYSTLEQYNPQTGERGSFTGEVVPETVYTPDQAALAAAKDAVKEVWEIGWNGNKALKTEKGYGDCESLEELAKKINGQVDTSSPRVERLIECLNDYFTELNGKESTLEKATIKKEDLQKYENSADYRFL